MLQNIRENIDIISRLLIGFCDKQLERFDIALNEKKIDRKYTDYMNLLADSFLTIDSFAILFQNGLISNASVILRVAIEQISTAYVLSQNEEALNEFLRIRNLKRQFLSTSDENKKRELAKNICEQEGLPRGTEKNKYKELIRFFDYGWSRVIDDKTWNRDKVIKLAHLDDFIIDIEYLFNPFAHGQYSFFEFIRVDDDRKYSNRIFLIGCILFFKICGASVAFFKDTKVVEAENDIYFDIRTLTYEIMGDLMIEEFPNRIKQSDNLFNLLLQYENDINYMVNIIYREETHPDNKRRLGQSAFKYCQAACCGYLAIKYSLCEDFPLTKLNAFELIKIIGTDKIRELYYHKPSAYDFNSFLVVLSRIDDYWSICDKKGRVEQMGAEFLNSFYALIKSIREDIENQ